MATIADSFLDDFDDDEDKEPEKEEVVKEEEKKEEKIEDVFRSSKTSVSSLKTGDDSKEKKEVPSLEEETTTEMKDLDTLDEDEEEDETNKMMDTKESKAADDKEQALKKKELDTKALFSTLSSSKSSSSLTSSSSSSTSSSSSSASSSIRQVSSLLFDQKLKTHMELIELLSASSIGMGAMDEGRGEAMHTKGIERQDEYNIILKSNDLTVSIDNEIVLLHKWVRDLYATRYHELEQLVTDPVTYAKVVKAIGNETDPSVFEKEIQSILPQSLIITITVSLSTTIGKPLAAEDLKKVFEGCDGILQMEKMKTQIFHYVESRMGYIAPNLSALIGSDLAAQLMGTAGGLSALSKIPSCNLQVLGQTRKTVLGLSTANKDLHMGMLGKVDLVANCPQPLRMRALRVLAAKVALAARIDAAQDDSTGAKGAEMREAVDKKIEKWQAPPDPKKKKALPMPLEKPKKRRGGRRFRKMKEKYKVTELQKQKNRVAFGKAETTDDYTGEGYGMIGQEGAGHLALRPKDNLKLAKHLSKATQQRVKRVKKSGTLSQIAGTASSIVFTPFQGMELVAPQSALDKVREANEKYFSQSGSFAKVEKKTTTPLSSSSTSSLSSSSSSSSSSSKMLPPPPKTILKRKLDTATSYNEKNEKM
eukprot:TRINITY_DN468_c0_g1_i1.p1 TRINITY_DN468_c0_g1~~TRINITY_DN468_c0_g1_i1.p1  ORF type:complete len:649 (-),score=271.01 TRINITY_DN468_c0_g1_i1:78-2024(-)